MYHVHFYGKSDETNASRPIFVTIVGALYMLLGILTLVGGILVAIGISFGTDDPASSIAAIPAIVVAIIAMLIGYGLLKGWKIMWYLGVIFGILGLIDRVIMLVTVAGFITGIISIIINLLILYYLFRPGVKAFFGI